MVSRISTNCNTLNQNIYNKYVSEFPLNLCQCKCGSVGNYHFHGQYKRSLKYLGNNGAISLSIKRIQCQSCKRTHAILHPNIVPYCQVPLDTTLTILELHQDGLSINEIMFDLPDIDECDIKNIIIRFMKHWKARLISIGQTIYNLNFHRLINNFALSFMQNKSTYYFGL